MRLIDLSLCWKISQLLVYSMEYFKSFENFHITFIVYPDMTIIHYTYSSISYIVKLKQASVHPPRENISSLNNVKNLTKTLSPRHKPYFISYGYNHVIIYLYPTNTIPWSMNYKSITSFFKVYLNCALYLANHVFVHIIWHIWIQDPCHICNIEHYLILKIPSKVFWLNSNMTKLIDISSYFNISSTGTFVNVIWSAMSSCSL